MAQPVLFEFRSPAALSVYPKRARRLTQVRSLSWRRWPQPPPLRSPRRHHASHGVQHASMVSSTGSRSIGQHEPAMRKRLSYCSVRAPSRVSACTAAALSLCVCDSRVQNSRCLFKLGSSSRSSSSLDVRLRERLLRPALSYLITIGHASCLQLLNGAAPRGSGHDSSRGCGLRTRRRSACVDLGCSTWLGAVLHHACDADSACVRMLGSNHRPYTHSTCLAMCVRVCMPCSAPRGVCGVIRFRSCHMFHIRV